MLLHGSICILPLPVFHLVALAFDVEHCESCDSKLPPIVQWVDTQDSSLRPCRAARMVAPARNRCRGRATRNVVVGWCCCCCAEAVAAAAAAVVGGDVYSHIFEMFL